MPRAIQPAKKTKAPKAVSKKSPARKTINKVSAKPSRSDALPDHVDDNTIERLVGEAERGIPERKLRRRGRPPIGDEASSTYSVRLPDDLVTLVDERSEMDGVARGETIRRALIDYLTRHLAGQPMTREEALAMRAAHAIDEVPGSGPA